MGTFHCPLGSPFYDSDDCILCELCTAITKEEMVAATGRIRAYLQAQAERKSGFKKIAICGKGGGR